jgi:hypothetical protein
MQPAYIQGQNALKGLDRMKQAGDAVLKKYGTLPTTEAGLYLGRFRGDPNATNFKAAQVNIISALRNITGTSRPNQLEIKTAIESLQSVANASSYAKALAQVRQAVQDNVNEMQQRSKMRMDAERSRLETSASISAMGGGSPADAPEPGYSGSF